MLLSPIRGRKKYDKKDKTLQSLIFKYIQIKHKILVWENVYNWYTSKILIFF